MGRKPPGKYHNRHTHGARAPIWVIFVGMMVVSYCIYIRNTQQMVQQAQETSSSSSLSTPLASSGCEAEERPPVAMMMVILGHDNETRHDQYWIAVANRRAYAIQHNIPLYLVTDQMGSGEHAAWEKLVALQAVFQHSCAEWVWMNDADAYIMNMSRSIMDLANDPVPHKNPKQFCSTSTPDIIGAGACLTKINTGSMLWRNNEWTQQFVSDAWHSKFIARPAIWWDQAAVLHMFKIGNNKKHVCIVTQRSINAFPNVTGCHDGAGTFKEGDLLVHFPGGMKKAIATADSKWLKAVPLLPLGISDASGRAPIFTVTRFYPAKATDLGQMVHVTMESELYAQNSTQMVDFDLYIQPQPEGFDNWGWPISPEPANHKEVLQQQVLQLQREQQQE